MKYNIERFGIHFVASPRHADVLLVTGPASRNMKVALLRTYEATPDPKIVIAVGACACSGAYLAIHMQQQAELTRLFLSMSIFLSVLQDRKYFFKDCYWLPAE